MPDGLKMQLTIPQPVELRRRALTASGGLALDREPGRHLRAGVPLQKVGVLWRTRARSKLPSVPAPRTEYRCHS